MIVILGILDGKISSSLSIIFFGIISNLSTLEIFFSAYAYLIFFETISTKWLTQTYLFSSWFLEGDIYISTMSSPMYSAIF